jgi:hypothetical protein
MDTIPNHICVVYSTGGFQTRGGTTVGHIARSELRGEAKVGSLTHQGMHRKHMEGLQVTEIRSINYSEFHNCFGAVHNGPD